MDFGIGRFEIGIFQRAAGQHGFLRAIEGDGTKFLPIADEMVFDNDFVNSKSALKSKSQ